MTDEQPEQKTSRILHIDIERDQQIFVPAERLHEQTVAIYDLLDDNRFALKEDSRQGLVRSYRLYLKTDFRHVYFDVRDEDDNVLNGFGMALGPFRRIVREYHIVCTSYYDAIRTKSPSQIQAIDMGRRGLHDEGAELLNDRLSRYAELDKQTARRLFTLVFVLIHKADRKP
jgi:uncharacterized protein (UPF0262 family)